MKKMNKSFGMQKKMLALFLTAAVCLSLLVMPASAFNAAGTWVSAYFRINGTLYITAEYPTDNVEMTLNADGTGSGDFNDGNGPLSFTYAIESDEIIIDDGWDYLYGMIEGDVIWLDTSDGSDEIWIGFERVGGSSHTPTPAGNTASFSDVKSGDWFYSDVTDVQRYGIINGVGNNRFDPQGSLSLAQAITMAARTHAYLRGNTIDSTGSNWYQSYVDYAAQKGICRAGEFGTNYNAACSRLTMALLFARVVPSDKKTVINDIKTLPDVTNSTQTAPVYDLYRYGILTGSDEYGTFHPDNNITRAETAAILNRVLDSSKRKMVVLKKEPAYEFDTNEYTMRDGCVFVKEYFSAGAFVPYVEGEDGPGFELIAKAVRDYYGPGKYVICINSIDSSGGNTQVYAVTLSTAISELITGPEPAGDWVGSAEITFVMSSVDGQWHFMELEPVEPGW